MLGQCVDISELLHVIYMFSSPLSAQNDAVDLISKVAFTLLGIKLGRQHSLLFFCPSLIRQQVRILLQVAQCLLYFVLQSNSSCWCYELSKNLVQMPAVLSSPFLHLGHRCLTKQIIGREFAAHAPASMHAVLQCLQQFAQVTYSSANKTCVSISASLLSLAFGRMKFCKRIICLIIARIEDRGCL